LQFIPTEAELAITPILPLTDLGKRDSDIKFLDQKLTTE
jgi:hypothetical protein